MLLEYIILNTGRIEPSYTLYYMDMETCKVLEETQIYTTEQKYQS